MPLLPTNDRASVAIPDRSYWRRDIAASIYAMSKNGIVEQHQGDRIAVLNG